MQDDSLYSRPGEPGVWRDLETDKIIATEDDTGWHIHSRVLGCPNKSHFHDISQAEFRDWRALGGGSIRGAIWFLSLFRSCKIAGTMRKKP